MAYRQQMSLLQMEARLPDASVCWPARVSSIFTLFLQSQDATPFCKAGAGTHSMFAVGSRFQDISLLGANSQVSMSFT